MDNLEVRILELESLHVVSSYGFGSNPEELAWGKLLQWALTKYPIPELKTHRFFGFNNPNPSSDNASYGYEQWMTVSPDVLPASDITKKDFPGRRYAVTRCQLKDITATWIKLAEWSKYAGYKLGQHQMLEECLSLEYFVPDLRPDVFEAFFDIYLPIA